MLKTPLSDIRKRYIARLVGRSIILICAVILYCTDFARHDILQGFDFFHKVSLLHVLWVIWVLDMLFQLMPVKNIALGSHKVFAVRFRPVLERFNKDALKKYNLFKWSLSDLPSDDDATLLQIKMYEDKIKELRDKLNPADD